MYKFMYTSFIMYPILHIYVHTHEYIYMSYCFNKSTVFLAIIYLLYFYFTPSNLLSPSTVLIVIQFICF